MIQQLKALWENRAFDNFLELLACRLLGRGTGLTVYRLGERRIVVDHAAGDQTGTKKCLVSGMYRDFFRQMDLPERPGILDLGGNGGGFTLLCDMELGPLGKVVSVEFNPDTYRRLWFNLKSNIRHDLVVLNAAAAGKDARLSVPDRKGSTSDRLVSEEKGGPVVEIEAVTLDTILERHFGDEAVDLCKIDIEGAEYEVLLSPNASGLSRIRHLLIEIHPSSSHTVKELESRIAEAGFDLVAKASPEHGDVRHYRRPD